MTRFADRRRAPDADSLWMAVDTERGGVPCALRIIETTPARAAALRMRIREASLVRHPNLSRWVALGEEDGQLLVAREWLTGPALMGPMDANEAVRIMVAVLAGLDVAHWHDLTHGRIAPERILAGEDGVPVLVDLGLEGQGSVAADLRAVADALESMVPDRPQGLRSVIARVHEGLFPTASDLQHALERCLRTSAAPKPSWGRPAFIASLAVPLLLALFLCSGGARVEEPTVADAPLMKVESEPQVASEPETQAAAKEVVRAAVAPRVRPVRGIPVVPIVDGRPEEVIEEAPEVVIILPSRPRAARVVVTPAPESAPVAVPEAPPPTVPTGKWHVDRSGNDGGVVLRLIAEAPVRDRLGRSGRPAVEVSCRGGRAALSLAPGIQSVERLMLENGMDSDLAMVEATVDGAPVNGLKLKVDEGTSVMRLPRRGASWLRELQSARAVTFAYTPFASPGVVARFDWTGFDVAWRAAGVCE